MEIRPGDSERIGIRDGEVTFEEERQACLQTCLDCARGCLELVTFCLQSGDEFNQPGHIRQLLVCGRICEAAADVMMLGSPEHELLCRTCSEICFHTAESFETYSAIERMRFITHLARRCGDACLQLSKRSHSAALE